MTDTKKVVKEVNKKLNEIVELVRKEYGLKNQEEVWDLKGYAKTEDLTVEDRGLFYELHNIMEKVYDFKIELEYYNRPIIIEGRITKQSSGQYGVEGTNHEYYSASTIEFLYQDDFNEEESWRVARVEYTNDEYYIYGYKNVDMNGLLVRIRK